MWNRMVLDAIRAILKFKDTAKAACDGWWGGERRSWQ